MWPTLARLAAACERIVLIAPPYIPYPHAWLHAGVDLARLSIVVRKDMAERLRRHLIASQLLRVDGTMENRGRRPAGRWTSDGH